MNITAKMWVNELIILPTLAFKANDLIPQILLMENPHSSPMWSLKPCTQACVYLASAE